MSVHRPRLPSAGWGQLTAQIVSSLIHLLNSSQPRDRDRLWHKSRRHLSKPNNFGKSKERSATGEKIGRALLTAVDDPAEVFAMSSQSLWAKSGQMCEARSRRSSS